MLLCTILGDKISDHAVGMVNVQWELLQVLLRLALRPNRQSRLAWRNEDLYPYVIRRENKLKKRSDFPVNSQICVLNRKSWMRILLNWWEFNKPEKLICDSSLIFSISQSEDFIKSVSINNSIFCPSKSKYELILFW